MPTNQQITTFQHKTLTWFAENKRDLPWRLDRDPYHILVSEVMLQQTQVPRVIPKYEAWLEKFPTITTLANAKTSDVLALWSGLGYNRRALYLQKAARAVVANYNGAFPQDETILETLPGIGCYTARAVLCFAFNKQIAVVDTNIRKVIALEFFKGIPPKPKELQEFADALLPKGKAYEWNQALMDYTSAMLKKEKVPLMKQSKFLGSNRYYRGQIMKLLVKEKQISMQAITELFATKQITKEFLKNIVVGLIKDGLIKKQKNYLTLPQ